MQTKTDPHRQCADYPFALDIDVDGVGDILLAAYLDHPSVLDHPSASVMFSHLTPDGITLMVTGYFRSPRVAADTNSDLLFAIVTRLRAADIPLSNPRTVLVHGARGGYHDARDEASGPRCHHPASGAPGNSANSQIAAFTIETSRKSGGCGETASNRTAPAAQVLARPESDCGTENTVSRGLGNARVFGRRIFVPRAIPSQIISGLPDTGNFADRGRRRRFHP